MAEQRTRAVEQPVGVSPGTAEYGSDLVVDLLRALGTKYVPLNPGSSFRGLHDSLVNHGGNVDPQLLLCLHEEIAVSLAHGYAKGSGQVGVAAIHDLVGLMHASMAVYDAFCDRVPAAGPRRQRTGRPGPAPAGRLDALGDDAGPAGPRLRRLGRRAGHRRRVRQRHPARPPARREHPARPGLRLPRRRRPGGAARGAGRAARPRPARPRAAARPRTRRASPAPSRCCSRPSAPSSSPAT